MRTYSKLRTLRTDHDRRFAKRRRLSSDQSNFRSESVEPQQSEATTPSSPPAVRILSSDALSACTSPPSSPPALKSAIAASRRPTFSFLARKDTNKAPKETNGNAQKPSAAMPLSKPKQKLVQMQLDLGGQVYKTCQVCGMEFVPSNAEDSLLHKKFHAMNVGGVDMGKMAEAEKLWCGDDGAFIVAVGPKSALSSKRRVEKVMRVVQADLGAVEIPADTMWEENADESGAKSDDTKSQKRGYRYKVFLYIQDSKCIGFCLAERISVAREVLAPNLDHRESAQEAGLIADSSSISTRSEAAAVLMGITRIWTSSLHRRKGIANTLLDCARRNFLYGIEIPKDMVAFSQPTESGGKLARRWFGMDHGWKAYSESGWDERRLCYKETGCA